MTWLYDYPDDVILLIFMGITLVSMWALHHVFRLMLRRFMTPESFELNVNIHESIVTIITLVLAFSLVQVIDNMHQVDAQASKEAAYINNLDRLLTRYGTPEVTAIRSGLLAYAKSRVEEDWPSLVKGEPSQVTANIFMPLSRDVYAIKPSNEREVVLFGQAVRLADDIAQSRDAMIEATEIRLAPVYWVLIGLAFCVKVFVSALTTRTTIGEIVFAAQMTVLSALFALVFIFDQPYKGESGVKPDALRKAIHAMQTRVY